MFGAIVLRDVPKREARIDLGRFDIVGGFRGFGGVPPSVWHYVSVRVNGHHVGFWCFVEPREVVVKVFGSEQGFADADADTSAQFRDLALSGAMGPALIDYPVSTFGGWVGLVSGLPKGELPQLHAEEAGEGSRFDRAFVGSHRGESDSLLAEFKWAFLRWLVSLDTASNDDVAFGRWRDLVLAAYNAGENRISEAGDLFPRLVDTMLGQFDLLPDEWFAPDGFVACGQADYMSEDMIDTGIDSLVEKGRAFAAYLGRRRPGGAGV